MVVEHDGIGCWLSYDAFRCCVDSVKDCVVEETTIIRCFLIEDSVMICGFRCHVLGNVFLLSCAADFLIVVAYPTSGTQVVVSRTTFASLKSVAAIPMTLVSTVAAQYYCMGVVFTVTGFGWLLLFETLFIAACCIHRHCCVGQQISFQTLWLLPSVEFHLMLSPVGIDREHQDVCPHQQVHGSAHP